VLGLLARNFAVTLAGTDRVAGRSAEVVEARRAGGTVAARVWLDRRTGLVLRREVYDGAGRTVQSAGFLRLRVGGGRDGDPIAGDLAGGAAEAAFDGSPPQAWTASVPPAEAGALRAHGWACPSVLPDGLTMVDLRRGEVDGAQVLQMVYSDGLTTLSLFEQRGRLDADRLQGFRAADVAGVQAWTRPGAPTQVVWQSGDSVMTLVADAPSDLAASVVAALSGPGAAPDGLVDRVGRGLARLADAMTPWS
jgi:sigma-E factor negative regulatory protein RseB